MLKKNTRHIRVVCQGNTMEREGIIFVYTAMDAFKKAGWTLLICWTMAVVTVFIPIIHLVTVPAFLFFGILGAFIVFRVYVGEEELKISDRSCPNCHQDLYFPESVSTFPVRDRCASCRVSYEAHLT